METISNKHHSRSSDQPAGEAGLSQQINVQEQGSRAITW